jgi:hypothetical protein
MTKYRKKPVVIEARLLSEATQDDIAKWSNAWKLVGGGLSIKTLEGMMEATPGDYIIQGVKGEFYPCKPDIFAATYEPVSLDKPEAA